MMFEQVFEYKKNIWEKEDVENLEIIISMIKHHSRTKLKVC